MYIRVQEEDFNLTYEQSLLTADDASVGAEVFFVGRVRDFQPASKRSLSALSLSHYPGMTETVITDICTEAKSRWQLHNIRVIHRIGDLKPQEQIVLVAVSSAHRADAFSGAEFIMDALKTQATFWKKEIRNDGESWLEMKESDNKRLARWQSDQQNNQ